ETCAGWYGASLRARRGRRGNTLDATGSRHPPRARSAAPSHRRRGPQGGRIRICSLRGKVIVLPLRQFFERRGCLGRVLGRVQRQVNDVLLTESGGGKAA